MTKEKNEIQPESQTVQCLKCGSEWKIRSEHAVAICKRGKCIGCLIKNREPIEMDPYEFKVLD